MACRQHVRSSSSISNVNQQTDKLQGRRIRRFFILHTRLSVLSVPSVVKVGRRVEVELSPEPSSPYGSPRDKYRVIIRHALPPTFWKPFWTAFQAFISMYLQVAQK